MKKSSSHLQYSWWKYLLIAMVSITLWSVVFDTLAAPKKNEQLRITCVGDNFLCQELEIALDNKMPELTSQKLKKITVENPVNSQSSDYHTIMTTRAYGADIIIVEESAMTETFGYTYFRQLPLEQLPPELQEKQYYTEDGAAYGILLYDGSAPNVFSQYYSGTDRCYIFITHNCENAAGIMGAGNVTDDAALRAVAYFMEGI